MDLVHALRLDIYLIDLFNLSYHFLEEQKDRFDLVLVTRAFNELLDLSLKRVRKGLKLMGFVPFSLLIRYWDLTKFFFVDSTLMYGLPF